LRIALDVETTGLEVKDRICGVGIVSRDETICEWINPQKKIPPSASAIHHITNEMVANAPVFATSKSMDYLESVNHADSILISHNAPFELNMLEKEGLIWQGKVIDTLKCAQSLMDDLEGYSLQFLRYELRLYKSETEYFGKYDQVIMPHNPLSDALHAKMIYEYLLDLASEEQLIELSKSFVLLTRLPFGKYAKKRIEEISLKDPSYLRWMLESVVDMDEDLRYSIEHYLR